MKIFAIIFLCLILFPVLSGGVSADSNTTVRVGVYENKPKVFTGDNGKVSGLWPDIVEYIASREGWTIQYVHGTWEEGLERLQNNQIDIMMDVAYTPEREQSYLLSSEFAYSSWSRIYVPKGSSIQSIPDLEGKTIAVMKGSINYQGPEGIKTLATSFKLNCTFLETDDYVDVFKLVDSKQVDAGAVSKDFAYAHISDYKIEPTAIVFQPAYLYFAFCKDSVNTPYLKERVDYQAGQLKTNLNSLYYRSSSTWIGTQAVQPGSIAPWLKWSLLAVVLLILSLIGSAFLFRYHVQRRTKQLAQELAERRQAEMVLKASEEKYRNTLDSMMEGCQIIDFNWRYIYLNHTAIEHSQRTRAELLGHTMMEAYPGIEQTDMFPHVERCMRERVSRRMESRFVYPDGSIAWFDLSIEPVPEGVCILSVDKTERKKALDAIVEAKAKLEAVFESMTDAVLITDAHGHILDFNDAFAVYHRCRNKVECASKIDKYDETMEFRYPDGVLASPNMWPVPRAQRGETANGVEYQLRRKDTGEAWWGSYSFSPIKDKEGRIAGSVVVAHDITNRKKADEDLKASEDKFSRAFNSSPAGMAIMDSVTRCFVEVNERWAEILEYTVDEMLGHTTAELNLYPDPEVRAGIWRTIDKTHHVQNQEVVYRTKSGRVIQTIVSAEIVTLKGKDYLVSTLMDVTESRKTERALRDNEAKLKEAQEMAHLGFWNWDVKTGAVVWSEEVYNIFQLDPERFTPRIDSIQDLSPWPEEHQRDQELIKRAVQSHGPGSYEQKFLRPDKSVGYYYSTFQGKYDEKNELVSIVGTVLDITERKQADLLQQKSNRLLQETGQVGKVGGWELDIDTGKQNWTDEVYHIHEVDAAFVPNVDNGLDFYTSASRPVIQAAVKRAVEHGEPFDVELEIVTAKGNHRSVHAIGKADLENRRLYGFFQDITERNKALEEHRKMIEYQELDRIKTNLLSLISHELRTPLASIKGYASLLLMYNNKLKKEQKHESLEAIDRSTDRLAELIDRLLDMSRLDAGLLKLTLVPVKPKEFVTTAIDEAKLRSPNFDFKIESGARLPEIMADGKRLRQIIDNLLENAVKYSPPNTVITVKTEVKPGELQISVTDQGRGIAEAEYQKIFERMYRIEQRLQKDPGGLGLGLSLCKALVEGHGGRIWVESVVGKGSTFYFTIPLNKEAKQTKNAEKKKARV